MNSIINIVAHIKSKTMYTWYTKHVVTIKQASDNSVTAIGLYRNVWIAAIASSTTSLATRTAAICVRFQGRRVRRVYVTMQITFLTRKSALIYRRGLRQRVASLTLNCNGDFAIRAYGDTGNASTYPRFSENCNPVLLM